MDREAPNWKGYFYATLLFLLACLQTLFEQRYMYVCLVLGMRLKTAVTGLVYRKILVMSNAARRAASVGEIVNLVCVDVQRLMDLIIYFNGTWLAPIRIIICFVFLWQLLGPSALTAIAVFLILLPLNFVITKKRSHFQEDQMNHKDNRARLTHAILSDIKIIKLYGWEKAFMEKVLGIRKQELQALKSSQILFSLSLSSFHSSTFLIAFAMFAVYTLVDKQHVLDAQKAFVSLTLINILNTAHSFLPYSINATIQAKVSLSRLAAFHDARVFRNTTLFKGLQQGTYFPDQKITVGDVEMPIVILGDPAYPLMPWLMKPYTGSLDRSQELFNYRLSKCRMVVECAFGRLKGRWRSLLTRSDLSQRNLPIVISACCVLHNLCESKGETFMAGWEAEANRLAADYAQPDTRAIRRSHHEALCIREALKTSFMAGQATV